MKRFYYFSQQRYAKSEMQTDYMYLVVKLDLFNFTTLFSFEIDIFVEYSVADLHSKILDARPAPWGSKFFQFHAVFGKFWRNRMLAPPPRGNPSIRH